MHFLLQYLNFYHSTLVSTCFVYLYCFDQFTVISVLNLTEVLHLHF